ncbi:MAG: hypothetical protein ACLFUU_06960 [Desulfobacteraceae bacterium]
MALYVHCACEQCYPHPDCVIVEDMNSLPEDCILTQEEYDQLPEEEKKLWQPICESACRV